MQPSMHPSPFRGGGRGRSPSRGHPAFRGNSFRGRGGFHRGGHERGRGGHGPPSLSKIPPSHQEVHRAKETSSRTLFVRNLPFEANSDSLKGLFEKYGEIRKFFDLVRSRGLLFVTYVSLGKNHFHKHTVTHKSYMLVRYSPYRGSIVSAT